MVIKLAHVLQFQMLLREHAMLLVQVVFKRSLVLLVFMNRAVPVSI